MEKKQKLIEISRSFSKKISLGNYEMAELFASAKEEVSKDKVAEASENLYQFVKAEVEQSAEEYLAELKEKKSSAAQQLGEKWQTEHNAISEADNINAELETAKQNGNN